MHLRQNIEETWMLSNFPIELRIRELNKIEYKL